MIALTAALALPAFAAPSPEAMTALVDDTVEPFVIGGVLAQPGEFPYMLSFAASNEHSCGGVLINEWTMMTTAGCFDNINEGLVGLTVRGGSVVSYSLCYFPVSTHVHSLM